MTRLLLVLTLLLAACTNPMAAPSKSPVPTERYRNLFRDALKKDDKAIQQKIDVAWQQLFYGNDQSERVYYPVGDDMAYILDVGNNDVRSEGMSYGMMISVQLDKKAEFDRLWKWAKTYMQHTEGQFQTYFAWHCRINGEKIDTNPASDGEVWITTALLFAAARWGNGTGLLNYRAEAQAILDAMLHAEKRNPLASNTFNAKNKQVVFVAMSGEDDYTDPSYHLPHYYELWAVAADKDNDFWREAAQASRAFFKTAAHPTTGLMPDYANFDGTPYLHPNHQNFRFDAWRAGANIAVDYVWFGKDPWAVEQSNRLLAFFDKQGDNYVNQFELDGKPLSSDHSIGLIAMNAIVALAADNGLAPKFVQALWDAPIPSGQWRYYDGMLYLMALLHVSGKFKAYL